MMARTQIVVENCE